MKLAMRTKLKFLVGASTQTGDDRHPSHQAPHANNNNNAHTLQQQDQQQDQQDQQMESRGLFRGWFVAQLSQLALVMQPESFRRRDVIVSYALHNPAKKTTKRN